MADLLKHSQVDESMTWDLTDLYPDAKAWEDDFKRLDEALAQFLKWQGHLGDSPESLLAAFKDSDALGRLEEKLYTYAHLRKDEDTTDSNAGGRCSRIEAKAAEISGQTAWFDPELMQIPVEKFEQFRNDPILAFYKRTLDETERERPHTLSSAEERILGMSSDVFGTSHRVFSLLNDADLKFPKIKNEEGKRVTLSHGTYRKYMESSNRDVRRAAFRGLHKTFGDFRNTFANLLESTVKANCLSAKLRHYPDALSAALAGANIPVEVYRTLIKTVRASFPSYYPYFAYRAERMGLEQLEMFDIQNSIVTEVPERKYSWQEATELVTAACRPLGEEYQREMRHAFTDRWIDIPECKGKRSGAYSWGCYDSNPYMLLNFNGTLDDVSTLAHELGHSMHSYFSHKNQEYHYASYHIFAAEIASTTNELLLHHSLMQSSTDPAFQAYLLNNLLDTIRGTFYRQTMFAEFELMLHEKCEAGEPLTADLLCEEYMALNAAYHGPAVAQTPEVRFEWARIPHFHYGFYVYQYATGISAAAAFVRKILAGETEPYLNFLKAGDSRDVMDIMKDAGVDFTTPAPAEATATLFAETLSQLKTTLSACGK